MSSCILGLLSPVLRMMVCGNFRESFRKEISLDDVEADLLLKLLRLACGKDGLVSECAEELLELGELAERLQMEAVRVVIEDKLSKELTVENCLEFSQRSDGRGLELVQKECYRILRDQFDVISQTEGFEKLSEDTIDNLLGENELWVDGEEDVFEALVKWMRSNDERMRGERLLRKIRYGAMGKKYLIRLTSSALLPGHGMLKQVVGEAMTKMKLKTGKRMWDGVERLCDKWKVARTKARIIGADVLKSPEYVVVDREGRIIVSDSVLREIIIFNRNGYLEGRIGSAGQFGDPTGVAVDRQGRIIVADYANHRIQVLNADGSVARRFGSEGSEVGQLCGPYGVAIDREGHIVVVDNGNHRIQVFDQNGFVVRHFGSKGAAVGQLDEPKDVAVDGAGRIVVVDSGNNRMQVFNGDGTVALCFGSEGDGPGQLKDPCDVAVDSAGRFVVADTGNDRVQVFNSDGSLARVIGSAGEGVGQLRSPCSVAIDRAGRMIVAEGGTFGPNNHRVQIF